MQQYSELLMQHFLHPQCVGELPLAPNVYVAQAQIQGGDRVRCYLALEGNRIADMRYRVFGCPAMIACMSWLASQLLGQDLAVARGISSAQMIAALELPAHKQRCALLAEEVLVKVLQGIN